MPLHTLPGQLLVWRLGYGVLGGLVGLVAGTTLCALLESAFWEQQGFQVLWLLPGLVSGLALLRAGWFYAQLRFARYRGEHLPLEGVRLQDGVWWQTEVWVPIARLQHLDVSQGPLDRRWGMAQLSLHTAGTHEQVLRIKGLPLEQAHALRAALLPHLHQRHD